MSTTNPLKANSSKTLLEADSVVRKTEVGFIEKPTTEVKTLESKETLHFQLDINSEGQPIILVHLTETADLITVSAHDLVGRSTEVLREQELRAGFYEFALPAKTSESLKYWQVSVNGKRIISFIR
ncbi:hypothetical protein PZB74_06570 [Porifericola rhodea]|uniref:hypothetical protein n=1 Tax=Porifericola rhodea TaxID=930972 RepID=UPI00266719F5|nr:hypothetical protein [Porifericola rhodea]WKN33006.1 hypothetical protein PZB74_06570 [Porifericola rhodea]